MVFVPDTGIADRLAGDPPVAAAGQCLDCGGSGQPLAHDARTCCLPQSHGVTVCDTIAPGRCGPVCIQPDLSDSSQPLHDQSA